MNAYWMIAATDDELVVGQVQARVTGHLAHQQAEAREHLLTALNGERYFALLDALDALVTTPPLGPAAAEPASEVYRARLATTYRRTS